MGDYNRTGKCCLCNGTFTDYGHNPDPLGDVQTEHCCDDCNTMYVLTVRLGRRIDPMTSPETVVRRYLNLLHNNVPTK